jgi:hypothetical protein
MNRLAAPLDEKEQEIQVARNERDELAVADERASCRREHKRAEAVAPPRRSSLDGTCARHRAKRTTANALVPAGRKAGEDAPHGELRPVRHCRSTS